jgi:hypothetical protein
LWTFWPPRVTSVADGHVHKAGTPLPRGFTQAILIAKTSPVAHNDQTRGHGDPAATVTSPSGGHQSSPLIRNASSTRHVHVRQPTRGQSYRVTPTATIH